MPFFPLHLHRILTCHRILMLYSGCTCCRRSFGQSLPPRHLVQEASSRMTHKRACLKTACYESFVLLAALERPSCLHSFLCKCSGSPDFLSFQGTAEAAEAGSMLLLPPNGRVPFCCVRFGKHAILDRNLAPLVKLLVKKATPCADFCLIVLNSCLLTATFLHISFSAVNRGL